MAVKAYVCEHTNDFLCCRYIDMYPDVSDLERRNMSAMISALDVGIGATVDDLNSTGLWAHTLMTV